MGMTREKLTALKAHVNLCHDNGNCEYDAMIRALTFDEALDLIETAEKALDTREELAKVAEQCLNQWDPTTGKQENFKTRMWPLFQQFAQILKSQ